MHDSLTLSSIACLASSSLNSFVVRRSGFRSLSFPCMLSHLDVEEQNIVVEISEVHGSSMVVCRWRREPGGRELLEALSPEVLEWMSAGAAPR